MSKAEFVVPKMPSTLWTFSPICTAISVMTGQRRRKSSATDVAMINALVQAVGSVIDGSLMPKCPTSDVTATTTAISTSVANGCRRTRAVHREETGLITSDGIGMGSRQGSSLRRIGRTLWG
jgi:hypothetical protein